jgi:predicted permease
MSLLRSLSDGLRSLLRKERVEGELDEELRGFLEMAAEEKIKQGMSREDALRAVRLERGNLEVTKEVVRTAGWEFLVETLWQDLRYAARGLRRNPGFANVAILSLVLGIGANSAVFSVFDHVMLKSLPVEKPQDLRRIRLEARTRNSGRFSYIEFQRLRDSSQASSGMAAMSRVVNVNLRVDGERQQESARMQLVSGEYFPLFGVYPILGRTLTPDDNRTLGEHPVAVISGSYWQRRFGGAPNILGQAIILNGAHLTIIGVGPRSFSGVWMEAPVDVWVPLMMQADVRYAQHYSASSSDSTKPWVSQEGIRWLDLIFRVKRGAEAVASVNSVFQQWVRQQAETIGNLEERKLFLQRALVLDPFNRGFSDVRRRFATPLFVLMAMVALVLLVACANIANLLLARGAARQREIAVRLSIGAGRARLIRQLLTESVLLSSIGAALGLLVAHWGSALLVRMAVGVKAGSAPIAAGVDSSVLIFTAALAVSTGILFGLAPAFRMTRVELNAALKAGTRSVPGRFRMSLNKMLVSSQVALSLLLIVGAGLFGRSFRNLLHLDGGFDRGHLLTVRIDPQSVGYDKAQLGDVSRRLVERVESIPGVRSAAMAGCGLSDNCYNFEDGLQITGYQTHPGEQMLVQGNIVGPRYFSTVGMQLFEGRDFSDRDAEKAPIVAIINEAMVRRYFAGRSAIGQHFGSGTYDREIIGVVRNARVSSVQEAPVPMAYYFLPQMMAPAEAMEVRTAADPRWSIEEVRKVVSDVDPNLPIISVTTLSDQVNENVTQERLVAFLTFVFGGLALGLACFGLYGVMSYAVARRTPELGIRMALGASRQQVLWNILLESFGLVGLGLAVGLPSVVAASKLLSGLLFGLTASDPLTISGAIAILVGVAGIAASIPAFRAARVDPLVALRYE